MDWFWLILAGFMEIGWAISLKYTEGFSKLLPSLLTILMMSVSFFLLSLALKSIPLGTAYAIWTGIGAVGVVSIGILFLGEPCTFTRLICIIFILFGIIGLKLT